MYSRMSGDIVKTHERHIDFWTKTVQPDPSPRISTPMTLGLNLLYLTCMIHRYVLHRDWETGAIRQLPK